MKSANRKENIALKIAGVLLCLTLLSLYLTMGLYGKYLSTSTSGDSAHTAAFYLEAKGTLMQNFQVELSPGMQETRTLEIVNKSEVRLSYTLIVRNETDNLPLSYEFRNVDTGEVYSPTNGIYTIEKTLEPGEKTDHYQLKMTWAKSGAGVDPNLGYIGMVDFVTVSVEAFQID